MHVKNKIKEPLVKSTFWFILILFISMQAVAIAQSTV